MSTSLMRTVPRLLQFAVAFALAAVLGAAGCGRTSLDDGAIPIDGLAGTSGSAGGNGAGGGVGVGGQTGAGIPCGGATCQAGAQACCTRQTPTGQTMQTCVPASDSTSCLGGSSIACLNSSVCPASEVCCGTILSLSSVCAPSNQCSGGGRIPICMRNADCPAAAPSCCLATPQLGLCLPPGANCVSPRGP